jgi:hypothetical protein
MKIKIILLAAIFWASAAIAYEINDFKFASLVKRYGDGYLVSIMNLVNGSDGLDKSFDASGFEKYLFHTHEMSSEYIVVDKNDYKLVETKCKYRLSDRISFFGCSETKTVVAKGEKYLLEYDIIGDNHIEDIYVFVKGNPKLDYIKPVWAKNYQPVDTLFYSKSLYPVDNYKEENNKLLINAHKRIVKELNVLFKTKIDTATFSNTVTEYSEIVYANNFTQTSTYLFYINGKSTTNNLLFCGLELIDSLGGVVESIFEPSVVVSACDYSNYSIMLSHYFSSGREGVVVCTVSGGMGGSVYLLFNSKNGITKVVLHSWHGC